LGFLDAICPSRTPLGLAQLFEQLVNLEFKVVFLLRPVSMEVGLPDPIEETRTGYTHAPAKADHHTGRDSSRL
jgi:hypothetical protein